MQTPARKYFCPGCRASFEVDTNFCGRCGADMRRASRLDHARRAAETSDRGTGAVNRRAGTVPRLSSEAERQRRVSDARDRWLGRVIDDRYKVVEVLGRGGMGVVYKVEHQRMGKLAAMKVLHHDLAGDPEVQRRFQIEAEAVSRLTHPNTVQVFDFGASAGALYLVMEYVRGVDIGSLIDRDGPLDFRRAGPVFAQIGAALEEAHGLGVVHRDLKPENLLVTRTHGGHDFVKVLDFGLAKLTEGELSDVTERGSIVGTPYYMSPEQIRGEDDIDHRSDVYSFGALMYRVLTGEPAFTAKTPVGVLTKHLTEAVTPPSKLVPALGPGREIDDIVLRCMEKRPRDRYATVSELIADIEQAYAELVHDSSSALQGLPSSRMRGSSSGRPAPALADAVDYGIDDSLRLQRSDLEGFERGLTRRRRLRLIGIPLLVAGLAGAAVYAIALRPEVPHRAEVEGNDTFEAATLIASGAEVTGLLGQRIDPHTPDRDFFRLDAEPGPGGALVTVEVSALPNIDVELALYDDGGKVVARVDEGRVGEGEVLRRHRVSRPVVVLVTGAAPGPGELPTENVSDRYRLRVTLGDADPRLESEPNDTTSDAGRVGAGAVSGFLDHRGDLDLFRFDGAAGRYRLVLSGGPTAPFSWRVDDGRWRRERSAAIELSPGSLVALRRDDRADGPKVLAGGEAYTIDLSAE